MTANANITVITKEEQEFIAKNIYNGKEYLRTEDWQEIIKALDHLELMKGYIDNDFDKGINDIGRYIERLIDKIAFAEILRLENDKKFKVGIFTTTEKFQNFLTHVRNHWHENKQYVFYLGDNRRKVVATVDTLYDTDSPDLEPDDESCEDFYEIAFYDIEFGILFALNYMNLPDEIYCDGERIV